jgi:hypothetical protein
MKIQKNKTRITMTVTAALMIGLIMLSPMTVLPNVSGQQVAMPANAIRTVDGGWVTPLHTHDEKGNPLTIHYEVGKDVTGLIAPPCATNTGLSQEGGTWGNSTNDNKAIGLRTTWTMPTGTITTNFGTNGFYYNPVNFYYDGPTSGTTPYKFFQVDWGIGGNTLSPPVGQNWYYTLAYQSGGTWQYTIKQMSAVTTSQGSSYTVNGAIEPTNLANPPAYVVQVTLGSSSWLYTTNLGYTPSLDGVYSFQAYQDEYTTKSPGATSLATNNVASPNVIIDNNGNTGYDPNMLNSLTVFNSNNPVYTGPTYKVLNSVKSGTTTETDPVSCGTW